jgi:hypothetical protein
VRRLPALLIAGALAAAACSDDDSQGTSATTPSTPATSAGTTVEAATSTAPTTSAVPTSPAQPPPTTDTPTTPEPVDVEALKAQIAQDYERAFYRSYAMVRRPSLSNLPERAARVVIRGSRAFKAFVRRVAELVELGDRVVPNDPDLLAVTVEGVTLIGKPPYRRAIVTACEVDNRKQVTSARNSSAGHQIEVAGSGTLQVIRYEEPVRLTNHGWLRYRDPREGVGFERGETTCPPA